MFKELISVPLFKDVDDYILRLLEPLFEPYSCISGDIIFEQGEPAQHLYLILEGTVEMLYKPYDGPQLTINYLAPGGIIGWSAVVGNPTYTSGAVCKEDCHAIRMMGRDLHKLCMDNPEAGRIILDLLAESVSSRWEDARDQIQNLLTSTVSAKRDESTRKRKKRLRKEF